METGGGGSDADCGTLRLTASSGFLLPLLPPEGLLRSGCLAHTVSLSQVREALGEMQHLKSGAPESVLGTCCRRFGKERKVPTWRLRLEDLFELA